MRIKISDLKKCFGEKVAVNISDFTINKGEILGLVGNNGAGKTTLFRLILDLHKADDGEVTVTLPGSHQEDGSKETDGQGIDVCTSTSEDWKIHTGAYIDEGFLIDFLTPEEYFEFIGKVNGMPKKDVEERLKDFEHFMGGEVLGQKKLIRNLSSGNKQKVGIISTLLSKPQLVILDEPFNFLDPTSQNLLKRHLEEYNKETDATVLISSHNLSHTIDICQRIVLLEHGEIVRDLANENKSAEKELEEYFNS